MQELTHLIGIKLLTSGLLEIFGFKSQCPAGGKYPFFPNSDPVKRIAVGRNLESW